MWTLMLATALAADPATTTTTTKTTTVTEKMGAGDDANVVFKRTTYTKVGYMKQGDVAYEIRCATMNNVKTCTAYDAKGQLVSTSQSVVADPASANFTVTWPDTFVVKTITYEK